MKRSTPVSCFTNRSPASSSRGRRTPPNFFAAADDWLTRGYFLAGYVAYEAGYAFVDLVDQPDLDYPLAILGVYREPLRFDHLTGRSSAPLPPRSREWAAFEPPSDASFGLPAETYVQLVGRVLDYLRAGDCYQINLTDAFDLTPGCDLLPLYTHLKQLQPTSYGALVNFGNPTVASFSPELHFRIRGNELLTRPMKGTARRGRTLREDMQNRAALATDEKNRAENVMIVDLLRNDVGRLCRYGTVSVPELFEVAPFGGVLQMTSTVRGELRERPRLGELFSTLFPSGSVTGAPKRRAMQIIRELERRPRGVYTGAVGYAAPDGDAAFSVAIRTLVMADVPGGGAGPAPRRATFGVGSGITVGSSAEEEYRECLLKGEFIESSRGSFDLFETLRCEEGVVSSAERHLDRLRDSAEYFGFPFDRTAAEVLLSKRAAALPNGVYRLRLKLRRDGRLTLASAKMEPTPDPLRVAVASETVDSSDPFLFHKTTLRERQQLAMASAEQRGLADLLFTNERGELTEGAVSNLFVEMGGRLLTPPVHCGLLPGVGRAVVLEGRAEAVEQLLYPRDLLVADALYLCSALRGLRRVHLQRD